MKYINSLLGVFAASMLLASCVDEFDYTIGVDKTDKILQNEYLNSFDILRSYVDRTTNSNFKLGIGVAMSTFALKEVDYSLAMTNFDEVVATSAMNHATIVASDGSMDFGTVKGFVQTAEDAGVSVFGRSLVWHSQQNVAYLNKLIAPTIIPLESESGNTKVADFENVAIGTTYPMTGNGSATVALDPDGVSGNALYIAGPANQSFPKIPITLPAGRKLGDYKTVTIDFRGTGSNGLYGSGMRMAINDVAGVKVYKTPANFGCPDGAWGRGTITMELEPLGLSDAQRALTSFDLILGSGTGAGIYYIDNISMHYETTLSGTISIANFESDAIGTTYVMSGNGSATVENDPAGVSGKVLHIAGPANYSFPKFNVKLTGGRKLGDLVSLTMDFNGKGTSGLYGGGMRMAINDINASVTYGSPSSFGCPDGNWGRASISLKFANLNLTAAQKALTEFSIFVGSGTGSGDYYIDNINVFWESEDKELIIHQTPEEKADTLTWAMNNWIEGIMSATNGYIKAWDVVSEPMSDANPTELKGGSDENNFYWQDYLGKEYARLAVKLARQHGGNDLKLFINEYGLETTDQNKLKGLIDYIKYVEQDGVTKIDGIGTRLHLRLKYTLSEQTDQETAIDKMFVELAKTGKQIRISELDIIMENSDGTNMITDKVTYEQRQQLGDFYEFIVKSYFKNIPAAQRYGITQWTPLDSKNVSETVKGEPIGLWNVDYNRTPSFAGFANGLSDK